jgi:hypothetical protein
VVNYSCGHDSYLVGDVKRTNPQRPIGVLKNGTAQVRPGEILRVWY